MFLTGWRKDTNLCNREIDRVFKKINEGLEIFNTYHERHENSTNPSQRDKLESDLKREIKKLQKLREQIKVWQTQNEVKDKEKLLEYRRLVEVAMEKYKVVEKGSKVKAYSNMSLKQGADLDPEEKEKLDTINFIQESIDDLERQFQSVEVEIEKLSGKKSKKQSAANETKKDELKELQTKYRWHQQQLELALRLLENDELAVDDILEIKEDLIYFLQSNRDPNFIDNEYIYESLDLESNDIISQEVVSSLNGLGHSEEALKEKSASPNPSSPAPPNTTTTTTSERPSPVPSSSGNTGLSTPVKKNNGGNETPKPKKFVSLSTTGLPPSSAGTTSSITSTLKPAVTPVKPVEMKWSALAAGVNNQSVASTAATAAVTTSQENSTSASPAPQSVPVVASSIQTNTISSTPTKTPVNLSSTSISMEKSIETNGLTGTYSLSSSPINEIEHQQDSELINLPPGIQDIILSFVSCRKFTNNKNETKMISNVSRMLEVPRDHLISKVNPINSSSLELLRVGQIWNLTRYQLNNVDNYDQLLGKLEIGVLFYGFYFGLTPFENSIIEKELIKRQWRSDLIKKTWFQRIGISLKQTNEFEISNFKKFDSETWTLNDLMNFKLDYKNLTPII